MRLLARRLSQGAVALVALAALGAGSAQAVEQSEPVKSPYLSAEEQELLDSGRANSVTIDPATGHIIGARIENSISVKNSCGSDDGCYYSGKVPYAHQGFYGSAGTARGNWPYRSGYYTGKYTARACWTTGGSAVCSQAKLPPRVSATFGGTLVTGTSFTIY
ncbi:hypothetical protein [Streptomyces sp. NPDC003077]|uniref:hypothetical protein n=1 Tax=Streptomyces sp. NPDC003077 TaxID=3154443 RepID=UPI0033A51243